MFLQIYKMLSNFDSYPLIFDPNLLPGKNSPNIAKSNHVFLGKGAGDRALILTYLDSPMAEVFPSYCLYFGPKVQTLDSYRFYESFNFFSNNVFFTRVLPLVRISAILDHIWEIKGPKTSKKGPFHGC